MPRKCKSVCLRKRLLESEHNAILSIRMLTWIRLWSLPQSWMYTSDIPSTGNGKIRGHVWAFPRTRHSNSWNRTIAVLPKCTTPTSRKMWTRVQNSITLPKRTGDFVQLVCVGTFDYETKRNEERFDSLWTPSHTSLYSVNWNGMTWRFKTWTTKSHPISFEACIFERSMNHRLSEHSN